MAERSTPGYTPAELMTVAAARSLAGVRTVFVGVGLPNRACNLARRTVAPELELIYEAGVVGARPARAPLSIGDPTLVTGATAVVAQSDLFGLYLQGGRVEVALLGGAQIDRYGNLNTTVIGPYDHPQVRLPGSGGACEIATNAGRTFIIMPLTRRAFVARLDFVTSPGHLTGGDARARLGLPGAGPALGDHRPGAVRLRQRRARDAADQPASRRDAGRGGGGRRLAAAPSADGWHDAPAECRGAPSAPGHERRRLPRITRGPAGSSSAPRLTRPL